MSTPEPAVANLRGALAPDEDAMVRARLRWSIEMVGNPPRLSHLSPADHQACIDAIFAAREAGIDVRAFYALVAPPEMEQDDRTPWSDDER